MKRSTLVCGITLLNGLLACAYALTYTFVDLHPDGFGNSYAAATSGGQQVGWGTPGGSWQEPPGTGTHALLWSGTADSVVDLHPSGFAEPKYWSWAVGLSGGQEVGALSLYVHSGPTPGERGDREHAYAWSGSAASAEDLSRNDYQERLSRYQAEGVGHPWNVNFDEVPLPYPIVARFMTAVAPMPGYELPSGFTSGGVWGEDVTNGRHGRVGWGDGHALYWPGPGEPAVDLHAFVPAEYVASRATGVDADGNIVGVAITPLGPPPSGGESHAVMWVPEQHIIEGVPDYLWNYGCSPTAAGMIIGYWDNKEGFGGIVKPGFGDTPVDESLPPADEANRDGDHQYDEHDAAPADRPYRAGTRDPSAYNLVDKVIASEGHVRDYWMGETCPEDGYQYPDKYVDEGGLVHIGDPHVFRWTRHTDDCLGDFMATSRGVLPDGITLAWRIDDGLKHFIEHSRDGSTPPFRTSFDVLSKEKKLKEYIDNDWPVILNIFLVDFPPRGAHTVAVYGYEERPDGLWVAVQDTWNDFAEEWPNRDEREVDGSVEWWKWDNSHFSKVSMVCLFPVGGDWAGHELFNDDFSRATGGDLALGYDVDPGSGNGTAEIVSSPLQNGNDVLKFSQPDGNSFVAILQDLCVADLAGLSFDYLFDTDGKIKVELDGLLLAELACPLFGPGCVGADAFGFFSEVFSMYELGLDPNEMHTLRIELSAPGDPVAYLDNLRVWNAIPEPATLALLAAAILSLARRRSIS